MSNASTHAPLKDRAAFYQRVNLALCLGHISLFVMVAILLPLVLGPVQAAPYLLLSALLANSYWAVLHEALHGHLFANAKANKGMGRVLAILLGSSFRLLRFGHLMHHRFNRHPLDRPDLYEPTATRPLTARLRFYGELLGGLYLAEILLPFLFLLPLPLVQKWLGTLYKGQDERLAQIKQLAQQHFAKRQALSEIRQDLAGHLLIIGLLTWIWGGAWPFLAGFYLLRGLCLSFVDNIYHFGTSPERPDFSYNLSLPPFLRWFLLHMNMHGLHHRRMDLPWWQLPGYFKQSGDQYHFTFGQMALAQLRGPLPIANSNRGT